LSNALLMSKKVAIVNCRLIIPLCASSVSLISWSWVDWHVRKPACEGGKRLLVSQKDFSLLFIMRSKIFPSVFRSVMGL